MFCKLCGKLAIINNSERKCIRCNGMISNNLSCICDNCSNEARVCSICLKRLDFVPKPPSKGCGCGGKK